MLAKVRLYMPGDYVDLGEFSAGSYINLFLSKNGSGSDIWWTGATKNNDNFGHLYSLLDFGNDAPIDGFQNVTFENKILIIGFEDLPGGGDLDYNDLVIAVEIVPVS